MIDHTSEFYVFIISDQYHSTSCLRWFSQLLFKSGSPHRRPQLEGVHLACHRLLARPQDLWGHPRFKWQNKKQQNPNIPGIIWINPPLNWGMPCRKVWLKPPLGEILQNAGFINKSLVFINPVRTPHWEALLLPHPGSQESHDGKIDGYFNQAKGQFTISSGFSSTVAKTCSNYSCIRNKTNEK